MNYDLIEVYAKAQQDHPEGVGVKHSLFVKNKVIGEKELHECTRPELNDLILALRKEYTLIREEC